MRAKLPTNPITPLVSVSSEERGAETPGAVACYGSPEKTLSGRVTPRQREKLVSLESRVAISDNVVSYNLEGEFVILNLESGTYFVLCAPVPSEAPQVDLEMLWT